MAKGFVLVTGGSRGIGRSIVLRFAREGFHVYYTYVSSRDAAEETARLAESLPGRVEYLWMDVSLERSVAEAFREIAGRTPYLNVLVNNAGILHVGGLEETSTSEWERVFRVNVTGVFLVTKYFLPLLRKAPWASIVNVASIAGQTGNIAASAAYAASKAAVIGFTRRLAVELAPGIRVNAVAPSFTETDMVREFLATPGKREEIARLHPLRDIARPEDVAEAVYFLAVPWHSRFITGQVLGVNGGRYTGC